MEVKSLQMVFLARQVFTYVREMTILHLATTILYTEVSTLIWAMIYIDIQKLFFWPYLHILKNSGS